MMWNYIIAHWRGRLGLLQSVLLNGVAGYFLIIALLWAISATPARSSQISVYAWAVVLVLWSIWALVGIFRCGGRNAFGDLSSKARRVAGMVAIVGAVLVGFFTAKDIYHMFVKPLF
jgi:hypothetical protein